MSGCRSRMIPVQGDGGWCRPRLSEGSPSLQLTAFAGCRAGPLSGSVRAPAAQGHLPSAQTSCGALGAGGQALDKAGGGGSDSAYGAAAPRGAQLFWG